MTHEKQFVEDSQIEAVSTPFNVVTDHNQKLYQAVKEFYELAHPSSFIKSNNELLNVFLENAFEEGYEPKAIQNLVFMVSFQNEFISKLNEAYKSFVNVSNPQTL